MEQSEPDLSKQELRRHWKAVRQALGARERARADGAIARRFLSLPAYRDADALLTYVAFGAEVETRRIIEAAWRDGKDVAVPWCAPACRAMRWFRIESFDGLVESPFGIMEPVPSDEAEIDAMAARRSVAVVPGLTFDARGFRLGYGGGFYDAFLDAFPGVSVGLCREAQLSVPAVGALDAHDRPVDVVVTERRVIEA